MADGPHLNPIRDEKYEEDDKDQTIWAKTIHCTSLWAKLGLTRGFCKFFSRQASDHDKRAETMQSPKGLAKLGEEGGEGTCLHRKILKS